MALLVLLYARPVSAVAPGSRIPWAGGNWYLLGADYPWYNYGNDFGSNAWGAYGVHASGTRSAVDADFARMASRGIHVTRWWVFSDGRAGITFDSGGTPTGLDSYVIPDLDAALQIAAAHNVYLDLVLLDFSFMFDASTVNGVQLGGHANVINTTAGQQALLNNVFKPIFTRYAQNPYVLSYEVMNEPEWAISEDQAVASSISQPSTLANFLGFTRLVAGAVHASTSSYVTVGEAAMKWKDQWLGQNLDYYQIHYYDWMHPYSNTDLYDTPYSSLGLDLPVVVGEYPAKGSSYASQQQYFDRWFSNGYAGAWPWSFKAVDGNGAPDPVVQTAWGTAHGSAVNIPPPGPLPTPPTVTGVSPKTGPAIGGTPVALTGTGFAGATAVKFGAVPTTFTVVTANLITATSPAGTGTVDVTVTNPGGTSPTSTADQFTYTGAAVPPVVASISPTSGPAAGGTPVTITGTGFMGATAVKFGTAAAASFTVTSATQINATSPAGTGTVDVTVTTPAGTSATSAADQFMYVGGPTVTAIVPGTGPAAGGTPVTITGTGFTGATAVKFGTVAATSFTPASATQILATSPAGTGTVDITVTTPAGTSATTTADQFAYLAAPGAYHPLTPARILDARVSAPVGPGQSITVQVTGQGGVPGTGVTAVVMNVTVTKTTAASYLTVYQAGVTRPLASNLNWVAGQTVPNLVEVAVGTGGQVSVYNLTGNVDVIFDVAGYVATTTGLDGLFNPLPPARILDTRSGTGGVTIGPSSSIDLQVTGQGGVPTTGVAAVVLNVTATNPTAPGYLTVFPTGASRPTASNLNFVARQTVPNRVMVKLGTGGKITIYNFSGTTDVVADAGGWFTDLTSTAGGSVFSGITPARLIDTRAGTGPVGPNAIRTVAVGGAGSVPSTAKAVVLNVTVTNTTISSYLTVWPDAITRPTASDLNWVAGQTVPNLVVVKLGSNGSVDVYNLTGSTDVVMDVVGWYS